MWLAEGCSVLYGYSIVYSIVFGVVFLFLAASLFLRRSKREGFRPVATSEDGLVSQDAMVAGQNVEVSTRSLEIGARALAKALDGNSKGCCYSIRSLFLWWRHVVLVMLAFLLIGLTALSFANMLWLSTSNCVDFAVSASCNAAVTFLTLMIYIVVLLKRRGDVFNSNTLDSLAEDETEENPNGPPRRNAFESFGLFHLEEEELEVELHLDDEDAALDDENSIGLRQVRRGSV